MKNTELILMLIDKSTNAFGQILGLSAENKLKKVLSIIQSTIQDTFNINSYYLSEKTLNDILTKSLLDLEQAKLLTSLLCTQAEILLELNQTKDSLIQYKNALQLLYWEGQQPIERDQLERKNKISDLETIVSTMKVNDKIQF
ncbi:MAG: hypothetical protein V4549_18720 [Bacteroidota bacterium]|jgi:hypothetical protein